MFTKLYLASKLPRHNFVRCTEFISKRLEKDSHFLNKNIDDETYIWRWLVENDYYQLCKYIIDENRNNPKARGWYIPFRGTNRRYETIFTGAVFNLTARMVKLLSPFECLYDINGKGENVFHVMARSNVPSETMFYLAERWCRTRYRWMERDYFNFTPLMRAIEKRNYASIFVFVECGAMWPRDVKEMEAIDRPSLIRPLADVIRNVKVMCNSAYNVTNNVTESVDPDSCCPICYEDIRKSERLYKLKCCSAIFHSSCLLEHLLFGNSTCPTCRSSMIEDYLGMFEFQTPVRWVTLTLKYHGPEERGTNEPFQERQNRVEIYNKYDKATFRILHDHFLILLSKKKITLDAIELDQTGTVGKICKRLVSPNNIDCNVIKFTKNCLITHLSKLYGNAKHMEAMIDVVVAMETQQNELATLSTRIMFMEARKALTGPSKLKRHLCQEIKIVREDWIKKYYVFRLLFEVCFDSKTTPTDLMLDVRAKRDLRIFMKFLDFHYVLCQTRKIDLTLSM